MLRRVRFLAALAGFLGPGELWEELMLSAEHGKVSRNVPWLIRGAPDDLPIPPFKLRSLVWGEYADIGAFFRQQNVARDLLDVIARHGARIEEFESILDFGCGAGRVVRQFPRLAGRLGMARVHGADINPEQIEWCRRNLPFAEFRVSNPDPPLAYRDDTFDLVYTYSVFTHLPESQQVAWLDELARVLKPGGFLLLTTDGEAFLDLLTDAERDQYSAGRVVVRHGELAGCLSEYGQCLAWHPPAYVNGMIAGTQFEMVDFLPGSAPAPGQQREMDRYFLRKRLHMYEGSDFDPRVAREVTTAAPRVGVLDRHGSMSSGGSDRPHDA